MCYNTRKIRVGAHCGTKAPRAAADVRTDISALQSRLYINFLMEESYNEEIQNLVRILGLK